jgi:hypothetical protein
MTTVTAAPRRPAGVHAEPRTLVALGAGLIAALWMADQIEMNLLMAFVLWVLIALRVLFKDNPAVVGGGGGGV